MHSDDRSTFIILSKQILSTLTVVTMKLLRMLLDLLINETSPGLESSENRFRFGGYMDEEIRFREILERFVECLNKILS